MAPAVAGRNGRCRMHGAFSGGPTGSRNGAFKTGKYSQAGKEVRKTLGEMRRTGEELLAVTLDRFGKKPPRVYRRRRHVVRALAEAKKAKEAKEEGKKA
jgi:hypothetical protein